MAVGCAPNGRSCTSDELSIGCRGPITKTVENPASRTLVPAEAVASEVARLTNLERLAVAALGRGVLDASSDAAVDRLGGRSETGCRCPPEADPDVRWMRSTLEFSSRDGQLTVRGEVGVGRRVPIPDSAALGG